jgi:lysophospholipase L1-like esterase
VSRRRNAPAARLPLYSAVVRIVLLGDSHLARVRRDLGRLRCDASRDCDTADARIHNAAVGGAFACDLTAQAAGVGIRSSDRVAVSVGTNDALPWKRVELEQTREHVREFLATVDPERLVYLTPFGVEESRLTGFPDGADATIGDHAAVIGQLFADAGAVLVDAPSLLAPLGAAAFALDGMHLTGRGYDAVLPALSRALCGSSHGQGSLS